MTRAPDLRFKLDDPRAADVYALIEQLDGYLVHAYPTADTRPVTVEELIQPNVSFVTARVDGTPVACGACVDMGGYIEIKRMYVLPACRGLGLGKQMLQALEDRVCETGGSLVRLETGLAQTEAIELYEHAGYKRCAPFGEHRANPLSLCMEKPL